MPWCIVLLCLLPTLGPNADAADAAGASNPMCGQAAMKAASPSSQNPSQPKEKTVSSASRPPPPQVPPVEIDGVVYAQVLNARKLGFPDNCGYLSASDAKTGERLWVQQIYAVTYDNNDETDVQEAYFKRLERVEGKRALLIESEAGAKFLFDIDTRKVEVLP